MTDTTTTAPAREQQPTELNAPWTLHFDRDGTEDFGIICDAEGNDLVASHLPNRMPPRWANRGFGEGCFWLPEEGDPVPRLVRQMQLMTAAPKLLEALVALRDEVTSYGLHHPEYQAQFTPDETLELVEAAIAEATDDSIGRVA